MSSPCRLCVLGSTGSIGRQTLSVVRENPGKFQVVALVAGRNVELLLEQIREFAPEYVAVAEESSARELQSALGSSFAVHFGSDAAENAATLASVDSVVAAIVGFSGLFPVLAAVRAGKNIALANKESLVAAGEILMHEAQRSGSRIIPVDSEHSSIFQCLARRGIEERPKRIILTASGGPFLRTPLADFANVQPADAVRHPTWEMGAKISIDSATLMNKGLEVIEAAVLFGLPLEAIEVLIHPESLVHGFVEYEEGTCLAALFSTDMRVPISFALKTLCGAPTKVVSGVSALDLATRGSLHFEHPDRARFPALELCYRAYRMSGTAPVLLNASNEVAVDSFLTGQLGFLDIPRIVASVLDQAEVKKIESLKDVIEADSLGRQLASKFSNDLRLKATLMPSQAKEGKQTSCPGL